LSLEPLHLPKALTAIGLGEPIEAKIGSVVEGTPAEKAKLKKGDKVLS